tara:strand:- start:4820 stop:5515 length:696 start_codon:yes stop_codon:yes gene_type:complete
MKKVISFSLWGDNPRYTKGAIRNVELAKEVYADWICRIHIGTNTPPEIIDKLNSTTNTEIIFRDEPCDWTGMFWRFEDAADPNVDVMICRDIDSRLTRREKNAVDQWLKSDSDFHIMRDHQYHSTEILGGMWGVKGNILSEMKEYIKEYNKGNFWQVDQNFLREIIYPIVIDHSFVHDEFFGNYFNKNTHPFPNKRDKKHFVGQAYAGNDKILDDDEYFCDYLKKQETYCE